MIYLASPYHDADWRKVMQRTRVATLWTMRLISEGEVVYCPLSFGARITQFDPYFAPPEGWYQYDLKALALCDKLVVLQQVGWEISQGVDLEMSFARNNNIPIDYIKSPEIIL